MAGDSERHLPCSCKTAKRLTISAAVLERSDSRARVAGEPQAPQALAWNITKEIFTFGWGGEGNLGHGGTANQLEPKRVYDVTYTWRRSKPNIAWRRHSDATDVDSVLTQPLTQPLASPMELPRTLPRPAGRPAKGGGAA